MSIQNLDAFFAPQHIALIGASPKPSSVGRAFVDNLLLDPGSRTLSFINPSHKAIDGHPCVAALGDLDSVPDLAIIATPPDTVPGLVAEAKLAGVRAVIVVSNCQGGDRGALRRAMRAAARGSPMRILGPDSQGVYAAAGNLNASLASTHRSPARLD
jgi:acetyltransferase